jgi:hypothetical protein
MRRKSRSSRGSRTMNAVAAKTIYTPEELLAMPDEKNAVP